MKPWHDDGGATIYHGDCRDVMAAIPADSIDTIITDPPYHLTTNKKGGTGAASDNPNSPAGRARIGAGFMGKAWDGGDVAFQPETWRAALRVAKPGAFLLAFGGTRTFHRLTCAIEDAGWEIRDCMMWLYGSGFPKSLDISKAIDKAAGAERERIGTRDSFRPVANETRDPEGFQDRSDGAVTLPATAIAKLWSGWGTAIKPAWEPIIVAMKSLDGTFAANAQRHGVAGLNIDGARIAGVVPQTVQGASSRIYGGGSGLCPNGQQLSQPNQSGRWPANVLLDEVAAGQLDEQSGTLTSGSGGDAGHLRKTIRESGIFGGGKGLFRSPGDAGELYGDTGGASRFFKVVKDDDNLCAAKAYIESCVQSAVSIAGTSSSLPKQSVDSALGDVVTWASRGLVGLSGTTPHSTNVTASELRTILERAIELTLNFASAYSLVPRPEKRIQSSSLASSAETQKPTGITTTTTSRLKFDGCAVDVTLHATPSSMVHGEAAYQSRTFYTAKASRSERGRDNNHPTVKPLDLMEYLCRLTATPTGGVVLDPFMGSGTTLRAALDSGRRCIGIEISDDYCRIARQRLAQGVLFLDGGHHTEVAHEQL